MEKSKYVVLKDFADLQDNKHLYHTGDLFPRVGLSVSSERVAELASENNKCNEILIKLVDDPTPNVIVKEKPKRNKKKERSDA